MKQKRQKLSPLIRKKIYDMVLTGMPRYKVAHHFGVSESQVYKWTNYFTKLHEKKMSENPCEKCSAYDLLLRTLRRLVPMLLDEMYLIESEANKINGICSRIQDSLETVTKFVDNLPVNSQVINDSDTITAESLSNNEK